MTPLHDRLKFKKGLSMCHAGSFCVGAGSRDDQTAGDRKIALSVDNKIGCDDAPAWKGVL